MIAHVLRSSLKPYLFSIQNKTQLFFWDKKAGKNIEWTQDTLLKDCYIGENDAGLFETRSILDNSENYDDTDDEFHEEIYWFRLEC